MNARPIAVCLGAAACALALAACGDRDRARDATARDADAAALPAPARSDGSVTGMPDARGPGDVPIAGEPPAAAPELLPAEQFGLPVLEDNPEAGLSAPGDGAAPASAEPTLADAEALVDAYYAAISGGDLAAAYASWSDGGRASGQTPEQFANGFAQTARAVVHRGTPGAVEGAAGSRFVEIPVTVVATRRDGSEVRYVGRYVLRRAVADGADAGQRAWRIASAELNPVE